LLFLLRKGAAHDRLVSLKGEEDMNGSTKEAYKKMGISNKHGDGYLMTCWTLRDELHEVIHEFFHIRAQQKGKRNRKPEQVTVHAGQDVWTKYARGDDMIIVDAPMVVYVPADSVAEWNRAARYAKRFEMQIV